jgi:hypothetical protein
MVRPKSPNKNNNLAEGPLSATNAPASKTHSNAARTIISEVRTTEMKAAASPKKTRKPEIVKTEMRSNLVPINVEEEVRRLAYLISERRGFEPGHETEDWLRAEREVLERYHQHTA